MTTRKVLVVCNATRHQKTTCTLFQSSNGGRGKSQLPVVCLVYDIYLKRDRNYTDSVVGCGIAVSAPDFQSEAAFDSKAVHPAVVDRSVQALAGGYQDFVQLQKRHYAILAHVGGPHTPGIAASAALFGVLASVSAAIINRFCFF